MHRDDEATLRPGPVATYRLVELGEATTPAPEQYACDDGRPEPSQPLPKPGGSLTQTAQGPPGRRARRCPSSGWRLPTTRPPRSSTSATGTAASSWRCAGRTTDAGRLAVVASVLAHQPDAERAGVGSAAAATALLKAGQVTTWDEAQEAAKLHPVELAKRFGLDRDQGSALSTALATTMATIEIVEEG